MRRKPRCEIGDCTQEIGFRIVTATGEVFRICGEHSKNPDGFLHGRIVVIMTPLYRDQPNLPKVPHHHRKRRR